jgi:hypothetical protein
MGKTSLVELRKKGATRHMGERNSQKRGEKRSDNREILRHAA